MEKHKISLIEAICIIAGYGIGSGVLVLPYYVNKNGLLVSAILMVVAFIASAIFHIVIAELTIGTGENAQIVNVFDKYLFRGKFKKGFTLLFFGLMLVTLIANLAIYISGGGALITELFGNNFSLVIGQIIFYVFAAIVVWFGIKIVGIAEKYAIGVILVVVGILVIFTFTIPLESLNFINGTSFINVVGLFSKIMFVLIAFFSIPQVVSGLQGDKVLVKKAVYGGLGINMLFSIIIVIFSLLAYKIPLTTEPTQYYSIVEWTRQIGPWAMYLGTIITILAFLTTFWSIALALSDMVKEQLKSSKIICFIIATAPAFILTFVLTILDMAKFLDYINLAAGAIAILVIVLIIPTYLNYKKVKDDSSILKFNKWVTISVITVFYLLMAIGALI